MNRLRHVCRAEDGAVFVQIVLAAVVLIGFNVFVLDYGALWVARSQAQNAADAGALAGAVARSYDDVEDPPHPSGPVIPMAEAVAEANLIWRGPGTAVASFDCPAGVTARCTRVDISRTIPTLLGPVLGVDEQRVRATATAVAGFGNASPCFRPIAIADEWEEQNGNDRFTRFSESPPTPGSVISDPDTYQPPSTSFPGNTIVPHDVGFRVIWELDQPITADITRGFVLTLSIPGADDFIEAMTECSGQPVALGQTLPVEVQPAGHTLVALQHIMDQDPGVTWNDGDARVEDSCAPGCASVSPRIVPIALFDPQRFQLGRATNNWTQAGVGCPTNEPCITVRNIVGFFVHGAFGGYGPHGHILRYPGTTVATAPTYPNEGSWLVTQMLIR